VANVMLLKFIVFFAIFAMFVTSYAEWSGGGEEVAGWTSFTSSLSAGPYNFIAPNSPDTAKSPIRNYFWYGLSSDCPNNPLGAIAIASGAPREDLQPSFYGDNGTFIPLNKTATMSYVNDITFVPGTWTIVVNIVWFNVTYPAPQLKIKLSLGVMTDSTQVTPCNRGEALFNTTFPVIAHDRVNGTGSNYLHYATLIWSFDISNEFLLPFNQLMWIDVNMTGQNGIDHAVVMELTPRYSTANFPHAKGLWDTPIIGQALSWFLYVLALCGWVLLVAGAIVVWFIIVTSLFFFALFALSFSGIFGPFGVVVTIFTTVFLSYLVMTVLYFFRGTSGSIGV